MLRFHSLFCILCAIGVYIAPVRAHMEMTDPSPWDSPTAADASERNYDIKSPLNADGSNFPCQGMTDASALSPTATYTAGGSYNMSVTGSANHNGGSCQLSLSYDNGNTFKVIKSMIGGCPVTGTSSYDFDIPSSAPSGTAVFAWTWMNKVGNREFYMDCAVVQIEGSSGGSLCDLPNLYVANIEDINDCSTTEGVDPVFPDPGTDVEYGDGLSSASSATTSSGQCELPDDTCGSSSASNSTNSASVLSASTPAASTPSRQMQAMAAVRSPSSPVNGGMAFEGAASAAVTPSAYTTVISSVASNGQVFYETEAVSVRSDGQPVANTIAPAATTSSADPVSVRSDGQPVATTIEPAATTSSADPVSIRSDGQPVANTIAPAATTTPATTAAATTPAAASSNTCTPRLTTLVVTAPPPAATCAAPVVDCDCASGGTCTPVNACTTTCVGGTASTSAAPSTLVTSVVTTTAAAPATTTSALSTAPTSLANTPSTTAAGTATNTANLPYATGDTSAFEPCNPGSFLCESSTVFYTCDQQGGSWAWEEPRSVADGMMCEPYENPKGYRDDMYVRAS